MKPNPQESSELHDLTLAYHEGTLTAPQAARLEALVLRDPDACAEFVQRSTLVTDLQWQFGELNQPQLLADAKGQESNFSHLAPTNSSVLDDGEGSPRQPVATGRGTRDTKASDTGANRGAELPGNGSPRQPGETRTHGSRDRRNDPSNAPVVGRREEVGWTRALLTQPTPMALTWATFFTLCVLIVLGLWPAIDRQSAPRPAVGSINLPHGIASDDWHARPVGRLVRSVNCRWAGAVDWIEGAELMADQTLRLESGRAMVVFYSGASAVLRGPVEVRVVSASEAHLERGMLVASVPSETAGFAVTTPSASIAYFDPATKFNVSVDERGETRAYVERGSVQASPAATVANRDSPVVVAEGNGFRLVPGAREIESVAYDDAPFEECRLSSYDPSALHALVHFRMGDDDPNAHVGQPAPQELVSVDGQLRLMARGTPTYVAGTKPDARAIRFSQREVYAAPCVVRRFEQWILEVRVRAATATTSSLVFYNGHPSYSGFGILVEDGQWKVLFGAVAILKFDAPVELNRWTQLTVAYYRGHVRLFVDGKPVGEPANVAHHSPTSMLTLGGHLVEGPPQFFNGDIDEVRLSIFEGSFHPDMLQEF